jgi:hypothetical protein
MIKQLSTVLLFGAAGFVSACGDDSAPRELGTDAILGPEGFPFVRTALVVSDLCDGTPAQSCALARNPPRGATMVSISQPEPGKLCVEGRVGQGGWAFVVLGFTEYSDADDQNVTRVLTTFDADALGITQLSFSIDEPPSSGLVVQGVAIKQYACPAPGFECRVAGFFLTDPLSKETKHFTVLAPFEDFVQVNPEQGSKTFDTSALDAVLLNVDAAGPVNFCISDFAFLDADGNEVTP